MGGRGKETARDAGSVSRRGFLFLAGSASVALGAIGCVGLDVPDAADPTNTGPAVVVSEEEAMSLRRQRYRRHAMEGFEADPDDFDKDLLGRYSADLFAHVI
jgi:hypothetical protein